MTCIINMVRNPSVEVELNDVPTVINQPKKLFL